VNECGANVGVFAFGIPGAIGAIVALGYAVASAARWAWSRARREPSSQLPRAQVRR
jgi:hypothetical protein